MRHAEAGRQALMAPDPSIGLRAVGAARARGWLAALAAALLLAGCAALRIGYNHADTLLLYQLDAYFDLDEAQEAAVRAHARELLAWHRRTELATYADLLEDAQRKLDGEVSPEDVLALNRALNARLLAIGQRAAADLARLALTLQPAQIERFSARLEESGGRDPRMLVRFGGTLTPQERERRYRRRAEDWFGPLTEAQVELVRQSLAQRAGGEQAWLAERRRRQQDLVALLTRIQTERPAEETAAQWLRAFFSELAEPAAADRRARIDEYRAANAALIAALVNSATPQQRASAVRKLRGYAADVSALAAAGARG